jgi:glyoxylase-like metal-dependent hydrolase (beta-lactamase superfamily II)
VNAYLLGEDPALLLDPGVRHPALDRAVATRSVGHVAVTHAHRDHAGAVAHYAAETGATVWARRGREARLHDAAGVTPDRTFREGDAVAGATVLDTPGHAPDHVAFATDAGVACGDLAVARGSVAVAVPDGDLRAYLVSLRRLLVRDPPALHPGHGPAVDDPRATLTRLYAHRKERERRVLAAVRDGARDPDTILERAYGKDLSGVRGLARATVVAHLEKLAVEGRVRWDPAAERATPT